MTIVQLIMVFWLANGHTRTEIKTMLDEPSCKIAEEAAHFAAPRASDVIDVGTICVKTDFDANIKARV